MLLIPVVHLHLMVLLLLLLLHHLLLALPLIVHLLLVLLRLRLLVIVGTVPAHRELIAHHLLLHGWMHLLRTNSWHELVRERCQGANFIYSSEKGTEKLNLEQQNWVKKLAAEKSAHTY